MSDEGTSSASSVSGGSTGGDIGPASGSALVRVALLHPGEMGAAIGAQLVRAGHEVVWLPQGRSAATRARAEAAGFREADSVRDCAVVLSIVPPDRAERVAHSIAGFTGH